MKQDVSMLQREDFYPLVLGFPHHMAYCDWFSSVIDKNHSVFLNALPGWRDARPIASHQHRRTKSRIDPLKQ